MACGLSLLVGGSNPPGGDCHVTSGTGSPRMSVIKSRWWNVCRSIALSSDRQHLIYGDCLQVNGEYYQNCCALCVYDHCAQHNAHKCQQVLNLYLLKCRVLSFGAFLVGAFLQATSRVPRWWIGERPPDMAASCDIYK